MDPDGPAMAPPDGQMPDFDNNGGQHEMGEAALIICAVLATFSVSMRVWSRLVMKPRSFGVVEGLLVCALGTFSGFIYICYLIAIFPGTFVHQWNLRLRDMSNFSWRIWVSSCLYGATLMLLKVAILVDWAHLFNPLKKRNAMFWSINILLAANVIFYVSAIFLDSFHCTPHRKIWDVFYVGGHCQINIKVMNLVASVINIISDVTILALPQWVIWRLNMTKATRAGVAVLFLIGVFAAICGLCRMVWLTKILHSEDDSYFIPIMGTFGLGEITAAFLIIGVPSVPRVFRTLSSQGSAVRTLLSRIRLLSWTGRRRTAEGSAGGSGRAPSQPPWRGPVHKKPRGAWEISDNDTFDLLSASTAHVEADRYRAHDSDLDIPQNSVKKVMRVEVADERMG